MAQVSPQGRRENGERRKHDKADETSLRGPGESIRQFRSNPFQPIGYPKPGCQGLSKILPVARPAHHQGSEPIHPSSRRFPFNRHRQGGGREKRITGDEDASSPSTS